MCDFTQLQTVLFVFLLAKTALLNSISEIGFQRLDAAQPPILPPR